MERRANNACRSIRQPVDLYSGDRIGPPESVVARGEAPVVNTLSRGSLDVGNINEYVDHGTAKLLLEPSIVDAELLAE